MGSMRSCQRGDLCHRHVHPDKTNNAVAVEDESALLSTKADLKFPQENRLGLVAGELRERNSEAGGER